MYIECKKYFYILIMGILLTDIVILLNIPFLRQTFGFLFLTILPGLLILQILKLNKIGYTEMFVLSVGISISFLMFFGLLINNLSLSLGYLTPLSTISLLISFNLAIFVLILVVHRMNKNTSFSIPNLNLTTSEKAFLIVPILFPALSIFGMHVMNTTDNNIILMFLLFLIPIYVAFVCFFNQKFPKRLYPVVIFLISISLLLLFSLRSNHIIIGSDTGAELFFFRMTLSNLHWCIIAHQTTDACLSISMLPTIYQSILCVNEEYLFKILYSLIFSISPLAIYMLSKKYVGDFYAVLASFFFMSQMTFLWTPSEIRTNTATLFCALAIMTLFHDGISKFSKKILFIIFLASTIVSHYSTTYIFFFVLLLTWFWMQILPKIASHKWKPVTLSKSHPVEEDRSAPLLRKGSNFESGDVASGTATLELPQLRKGITITVIMLFFTIIFLWYSQLTDAAFNSGVVFIQRTILNLNEFFILESRGRTVETMLGKNILQREIPVKIEFFFTWMTLALVGIGLISMIYMYRKKLSIFKIANAKSQISKTEFAMEYVVMTIVCCVFLFIMVAFPFISRGYDIQRLYLQMMIVLSLCFVLGGIALFLILQFVFINGIRWFRGLKSHSYMRTCEGVTQSKDTKIQPFLIILIVLLPYFLCTTGALYQIFGIPRAITLNSEGPSYDRGYIHDQECRAAKYLSHYADQKKTIYTNAYGYEVLSGEGKISPDKVYTYLIPTYEEYKEIKGYIYLRYHNVVNDEMMVHYYNGTEERRNMTEYSDMFIGKNKIYYNGGSEIWK